MEQPMVPVDRGGHRIIFTFNSVQILGGSWKEGKGWHPSNTEGTACAAGSPMAPTARSATSLTFSSGAPEAAAAPAACMQGSNTCFLRRGDNVPPSFQACS